MKVNIFETTKKYEVIYADPPWRYNDKRTGKKISGGAVNHYPTMKFPEIQKLPVKDIAADNCMLFLWVTFPMLKEGLQLIEDWGFTYKTLGFSWIKTNKKSGTPFFGIGYYTKSNCEVCLLGVKGKPFKVSNSVSSVLISPKEEHSKKPDKARDKIVQLCGDVSRIELFARQQYSGWDCWGNEV